jgi:hypothetical protein
MVMIDILVSKPFAKALAVRRLLSACLADDRQGPLPSPVATGLTICETVSLDYPEKIEDIIRETSAMSAPWPLPSPARC